MSDHKVETVQEVHKITSTVHPVVTHSPLSHVLPTYSHVPHYSQYSAYHHPHVDVLLDQSQQLARQSQLQETTIHALTDQQLSLQGVNADLSGQLNARCTELSACQARCAQLETANAHLTD